MKFSNLVSNSLIGIVRLLLGASPRWIGCAPENLSSKQCVYFANHTSHIDTLALWAALPPDLRNNVRPVAAKDYWMGNALKRYIALKCLNVVLLERELNNSRAPKSNSDTKSKHPLTPLIDALKQGDSLIIFPEGTRKAQALPSAFKSGIHRLWEQFPEVAFIPVYLENLHRSMPKGSLVPVPLICTVRFGTPLLRVADESKIEFLHRAHGEVLSAAESSEVMNAAENLEIT